MTAKLTIALQAALLAGALVLIALDQHDTALYVSVMAAVLTPAATRCGRCALGAAALVAFAPAASGQDDDRDPPLFVVEDADSRVYLLSSVHLLPEGSFPLPAAVEAAYAEADVVAFELDYDALQAEAPAAMQAGMGETSVADALDADQKAAFDAYIADLGMPAGALDAVEPWMAGLSLMTVMAQRAGITGEGVDAHFWARAGDDAKERVPFETLAGQIGVLDDLAVEDQVAFLMSAVESEDDPTEVLGQLLEAWSEGDDGRLAELVTEGRDATPAVYEALFTIRNRAWVPQVEALLARDGEDALVVVGAGHLVGEESVVEMLRAEGHTVTRL